MPLTPFHFGPHACVALPLRRYIDVPVFICANVAVDIEPLLVMLFGLDYPLHGYCHTLLIGGLLGLLFAMAAYPFRPFIGDVMSLLRLTYSTTLLKMAVSGILGAWLHVLFDAVLYVDIKPFYPLSANPLYDIIPFNAVYVICTICFLPAFAMYLFLVRSGRAKTDSAG